jgi:putative ABC transport system substrate-binding protein
MTVLVNPATAPYAALILQNLEEVAPSLGLAVRTATVNDASEIESALVEIAREARGGLLPLLSTFTVVHRNAIIALAARYRLPTVYPYRFFVAAGGLMSYGVDPTDQFRRSADYIDRILKGAEPADLPVQQPTKYEMAINLKTAKALGIAIAPFLLSAADEVIE